MGEILVGRWSCPSCKTENSGNDYSCKSCGSARPENVEFYLTNESEMVTDEREVSDALSGADWICEYCGSSNTANAKFCSNCGNSFDGVENNQKEEDLTTEQAYMQNRNKVNIAPQTTETSSHSRSKGRTILKFAVLAAFVIVIIGVLVSVFGDKTSIVKVNIAHHYWQRTIDIEKFTDKAHSDWYVPSGAKVTSSHLEIYTYDRVLTGTRTRYRTERYQSGTRTVKSGYKNLGNGKFQSQYRTEPVYSTRQVPYTENVYKSVPRYKLKYYYTIKEWVKIDHREAHGNSLSPVNPKYVEQSDILRNSNPTEDYEIIMKDKDKNEYKKSLPYDTWLGYKDGQSLKIQVDKKNDTIEIIKKKNK